MLELTVKMSEVFSEKTQEFVSEELVIELEHSLVSLSKWESKYEKPFLDDKKKTTEETLDYIRYMILTPDVPSNIVEILTQSYNAENMKKIETYLSAKMTATWFSEPAPGTSAAKNHSEKITSELIYYWIVSYQIPWEVQHWHINRLFTLIKVFNAKNSTQKKMNPGQIAARNRELNAQRLRELGTKG